MTHRFRRTAATLADGRELIYFDDSPSFVSGDRTRQLCDARPLSPRFDPVLSESGEMLPPVGPHMRRDPLTGDWIPMASHRMNRTFLPTADTCPLCPARPGAEYSDGEIPDTDYDVAVFENRFPSLLAVPGEGAQVNSLDGEAIWQTAPAAGRCEVVCFSPEHEASVADLPENRIRTIIEAWVDRTESLMKLDGVQQVFCFENRGPEIGVTLPHPHGQIYAFPYIPARTEAILRQARQHEAETGGHLLSDIVAAEIRSGRRIVAESEHWVAYVPGAARWPVEVHLAPRRQIHDFTELTEAEKAELAREYLHLLRRLDQFFVDPNTGDPLPLPYIAGWHQAVKGEGRRFSRLHLQLFSIRRAPGKLKYLAGAESGMAAWISDTTPELIADRIRQIQLG